MVSLKSPFYVKSVTMVLFRYWMYFAICIFVPAHHAGEDIISDLGTMIKILTGKEDIEFNVYGLYCIKGYGGFGIPVDSIDRCCQEYTFCSENVRKSQCLLSRMEKIKYDWHYDGTKINCVNTQRCLKSRCICDKQKASCLRDHIDEYNPSFLGRFLDQIIGK